MSKSKQDLFEFKGMNEKIPTLQLNEKEQEASEFSNVIGFRMKFLKRQFTFKYHSVKDVLSMLGGILGLFKKALGEIGIYMTIAFFIWFMIKIT